MPVLSFLAAMSQDVFKFALKAFNSVKRKEAMKLYYFAGAAIIGDCEHCFRMLAEYAFK